MLVRIVDIRRCLSPIKHSTKPYLVSYDALAYVAAVIMRVLPNYVSILSEELFYLLDISRITLNSPLSLHELLKIAVQAENPKSSALGKGRGRPSKLTSPVPDSSSYPCTTARRYAHRVVAQYAGGLFFLPMDM